MIRQTDVEQVTYHLGESLDHLAVSSAFAAQCGREDADLIADEIQAVREVVRLIRERIAPGVP